MKSKLLLLFLGLLLTGLLPLPAAAQLSALELIRQNRYLSASNYCPYPDSVNHPMTPPPAGKKAFYLSHYGRHGSRYLSNRKAYDIPYRILHKADSLGKLTETGKQVYAEICNIINDSEDRWGDLSGLGKKQHRDIARRMTQRFPEIFEGNAFVDARSTIVTRCIISMGTALQQLVAFNPRLTVSMRASVADMWYLNHQDRQLRGNMMPPAAKKVWDDFCHPKVHNWRLMQLLFTDTAYVRKDVDDVFLNYYLLKSALIQQNTHMVKQSRIMELFTLEDIHRFWQEENAWWYICYGPSLLNGGHQPYTQRYLLRQMIQEADSCMRLKRHGASLRYGHETVVLPLVCLLGINGFDFATADLSQVEAHGWWACTVFPMASNVQFVFYRENAYDEDVIFKVLLNEKEATLPLPTDIAPYYHWRDFREYYLRKLDAYDSRP